MSGLTLFAVEGTRDYGERVARHLELILGTMRNASSRMASTRSDHSSKCGGRTSM
jgi:hypothetical protein